MVTKYSKNSGKLAVFGSVAACLAATSTIAFASFSDDKVVKVPSNCDVQSKGVRKAVRCYLDKVNAGDVVEIRSSYLAVNSHVHTIEETGTAEQAMSESEFKKFNLRLDKDAQDLAKKLKGRVKAGKKLTRSRVYLGDVFEYPVVLKGEGVTSKLRITAQKVAPDGTTLAPVEVGKKQPPFRWNIQGVIIK